MKHAMVLSAMTAVGLLCAAGSAQVVISQVYGGGGNSGATLRNDFIELKNIGSAPVDISGWSVQYSSATGAFQPTNNSLRTVLTGMVLQPGQYYLIQEAQGTGGTVNLPTPDMIGSIAMSATGAKIVLINSSTGITDPTDPSVVDFVGYGTANAWEGSGAVPALTNTTAAIRNDNGCQDTNDNSANFTVSGPTPHNSSNTIPCGATFPDVAIQFNTVQCGPLVGDAYQVTAVVSNLQPTPANNTVATIVLPPTFSYTSADTGGVGTVSYDSATRTLTWNAGTFGASASANLTINGTAVAMGGLTVSGTVSSTSANEPTGNNSAIVYNEVQQTGDALGVIAVASNTDPAATSVFESIGGFSIEWKLGTIYRPFTSQNGEWIVFRTDLAGQPSETNGAVIVGHRTGSNWSFDLVAHEGITTPIAGHPTWIIDANTFGNILGINNSGEYVYSGRVRDNNGTPSDNTDDVLHWFIAKGTVAGGVSMTIKGANTGAGGGTADADAPSAPELAGKFYNVLSSATIQNNGSVSFSTTLTPGSTGNAAFLKNSGATLVAQKDVTVPTGSTFPWNFMDSDSSSDGAGFMVSADGSSWLGTGRINTGGTTNDNVVVVNGVIVAQEGSPVGNFTDGVTWGAFGSQNLPWGQMMPDGHWFLQGFNGATSNFNSGQDWVMRDGTIVARTGAPIVTGSSETWADNILQRTFAVETGAGDNYVVGGLTNRSTTANGSDDSTDGVIVFGNQVLVREGVPVQVAEGDIRYFNNFNDDRSFISGTNLYTTTTLRPANATCTRNFSNLAQAIVVIPLPTVNPPSCPADVGIQGGLPGSDGALDNNDFIAFITYFFNSDPHADQGIQGGLPGHDGAYDNNDFIAFINNFFAGCPH